MLKHPASGLVVQGREGVLEALHMTLSGPVIEPPNDVLRCRSRRRQYFG